MKSRHIRVIAPSHSLAMISSEVRNQAIHVLGTLGYTVSYSKHCNEKDEFNSSSVLSRVADIHDAFSDPSVDVILTAIGGFNSCQLLPYLDFDLIRINPKILCGYSDITALQNACLAQANLMSFSGPHFSTFGCQKEMGYVIDYFQKCLFSQQPIRISPGKQWSDDLWYIDQHNRIFHHNEGVFSISQGQASGKIIGGNLQTFTLLRGSKYMPSWENAILFIEDDDTVNPDLFDRSLQSLILQPSFSKIRGLVFGRFQQKAMIPNGLLFKIIQSKPELNALPIIAGLDFGHTLPMFTFPIGGTATIYASPARVELVIESRMPF
ncbi:MAG: LD-carboxypeptidase [Parachlamydiales bacterium]|nr:LD-carboxypeptidase [Parachlamydiales bacterium]